MKIGILTFHCAYNYGAVLQAYAMQEYLRSMGHESCIVDYRPDYMKERYERHTIRHWLGRSLSTTVAKVLTEPFLIWSRCSRYNKFERFIQTRLTLVPVNETNSFDAIVLGSDQIWQPSLTGGSFDQTYFGEGFSCGSFSYAASSRISRLTEDERDFLIQRLNMLKAIGVRELKIKELLQPLTQKAIAVNMDPTLMAGENWIISLQLDNPSKGEYVFVYEIQRHRDVRNATNAFAKKNGFKSIEVTGTDIPYLTCSLDRTTSPEGFCAYIKFAKCIFTTSFHGVALSILLKRPFYYFIQHTNSDERILSLLRLLHLENRAVEMNEELPSSEIDYSVVKEALQTLQKESRDYINNALALCKK